MEHVNTLARGKHGYFYAYLTMSSFYLQDEIKSILLSDLSSKEKW